MFRFVAKAMYSDQDRILALAGIYQAAYLAQQTARHGVTDTAVAERSINSLLKIDADSVADVFEGAIGVTTGLDQLCRLLSGRRDRDLELTRFVVQLLQLERKLSRDGARLQRIGSGIEKIKAKLTQFHVLHANILAQLAELYVENISTLQPRILVRGEPLHLQHQDNVNRIRSLLLAGVRSARLWRQVGGRRRQLLFGRRALLHTAQELLAATGAG